MVLIYSGINAFGIDQSVVPLYFTKNISESKMSLTDALASGLLRAAALDFMRE